jgi:membrane protease YdiL (CAAX protease family)
MSENATALVKRPHVRVAFWLFLIALTFTTPFVVQGVAYVLGLVVSRTVQGLPLIGCVLALLMVFWSPDAFGLRLGNHRKVWWVYLAYAGLSALYSWLWGWLAPDRVVRAFGEHIWPSTYLLAPFREELLFRGFMYGVLAEMYPESEASARWISKPVLLTSVLFGLWHFTWVDAIGLAWGLEHVAFTFGVGLVYGYIRRRSGSVLGPFLLHTADNFAASL